MRDPAVPPLVELRGISAEVQPPYDSGLHAEKFTMLRGELTVVEIACETSYSPLADIISGLRIAAEGTATFDGLDWRTTAAAVASRARSRIGRVFDGTAIHWLSNLDLDENLTLPFRFHHGPITAEVEERIEHHAKQACCWPLAQTRPAATPKNVLRRAEWVRAFLGEPLLVILERPLREVGGDTSGLVTMAADALKRGAAILLVTRDSDPWQSLAPKPAARWTLDPDGRLVEKN